MASQAEMDTTLSLSNSDNPNMKLVSILLTGPNYLSWTRSMLLALRAKEKIGFVTGKIAKPPVDSPMHEKWLTVDSMVISWILNAISREIAEGFLYTNSSQELLLIDLVKVMDLYSFKSKRNW